MMITRAKFLAALPRRQKLTVTFTEIDRYEWLLRLSVRKFPFREQTPNTPKPGWHQFVPVAGKVGHPIR